MEKKQVRDLEALGHEVVEEAGGDTSRKGQLQRLKSEKKDAFHSDLIYALMSLRFSEREAIDHWRSIVKHKAQMSQKLKRNVGVRVAALDYFKNIKGMIKSPKILEVSEFASTSWRAITDSLTGLYNHRYFQNEVNRQIDRCSKSKGCFSIILLDIDFFKEYNDTNGHVAGDVVLVEVSGILKKNMRESDTAARYGGDEYAIVVPDLSKKEAFGIAERIRIGVKKFPFANEEVLPGGEITISGGVATYPEDSKLRQELIAAVDSRLYRAKRSGRNRICF